MCTCNLYQYIIQCVTVKYNKKNKYQFMKNKAF